MTTDDDEHVPDRRSTLAGNQALKMAGQVARIVRGHYDAFLGEGFTERQAAYLAIAWVKPNGELPPP